MIIIISVGINSAKFGRDRNLHIVMCDVGQGDGIFITTPLHKQLLIDGGPDTKIQKCIAKHSAFYDRSLTAIFISHFHADHITGFIELLNGYSVQTIFKNELNYATPEKTEFEKRALDETADIQELWQLDSIAIEPEVNITVLWPQENTWNRQNGNWEAYIDDLNDSSLVLLMRFKNLAILFTGDAGTDVLDRVAELPIWDTVRKDAKTRIYKVAHHGSRDAVSAKLLAQFQPGVSLISAGNNNKFNHPHRESIDALTNSNIAIYRTDRQGSIELTTDGDKLWVKTERHNP